MAYTRTNWVEEETPLSAQNMNNIEDGIEELQAQKVDKVSGKALSDNNYTTAEKTKLAGIEEGAQVNPGEATTSASGLMSAADKTKLDGVQAGAEVNRTYGVRTGEPTTARAPMFGSFVTVSQVKQDASGQISLIDRTIRIPDNDATTATHGLMSTSDKTKLNNVSIRIATAATLSSVSIPYRETKVVRFKYKTSADYFTSTNMVVPIDIPDFSIGLAISSYYHETGYFNIKLTNTNPNTRTVSSGKEITLLVIDNEVS